MQDLTESSDDQPRFGAGRFPNPTVMNAGISSTDVENEDGSYEVKNVLWSTSGFYYEFSIVIKKSIYGLVVRANVLEQTSPDTFRRTGRDVAIKVCAKDVLVRSGGVSLENPITEIGAMQDVGEPRHPNIATQIECCVDEKNIYSVLKFHHGVELFDHILNNGPLNETAARCMFQQLMLAVFRLQCRDIAHRDISLENIMYNAADHGTVLIDFGLCVKLQRDTRSRQGEYLLVPNAACGKSYYMPPESAWDGCLQLVNPMEGDVWSAGMCLLYALLGFPPIERACDDDVRYKYLTQGRLPELLEHWQVCLSAELVELIQAMLRPEPSERPSVRQILQHSWMQRDGLPYPFPSELSAEELAAACGFQASTASAPSSLSSSSVLPALEHPHVEWGAVDAADSEMDVGVGAEGEGEGEGEEFSMRSSVESRWSCTTTPTAAHGHAVGNNISSVGGAQQAGGGAPLHCRSGSFSSTCTTHLPYNTTSYTQPTSSSNYQHHNNTYQHHGMDDMHIDTSSPFPSSLQQPRSGLSSGASSGAATPNTHSHPFHSSDTGGVAGALHHAGTSVTGASSVGAQQQQSSNPFGLRINTRASSRGGTNNNNTNTNTNTNTSHNSCYSNDYTDTDQEGGSPDNGSPIVALNLANAATTIPNRTNTSSSTGANGAGKGPGGNFTGYHTRSHSFGKANINYAV